MTITLVSVVSTPCAKQPKVLDKIKLTNQISTNDVI
jgi:hypothetical protein